MNQRLRTILVDFDGVLHSYTSGWKGPTVVADPPVPGAIKWLSEMVRDGRFEVAIYSSRSREPGGVRAMVDWFDRYEFGESINQISFPTEKPPAHLTIDDRAICFNGTFPDPDYIAAFKPWNKRSEEVVDHPLPNAEAQAWKDTAAQFARNAEYYQGLVVQIGKMLGPEAYIADDGTVMEDVLCAKVPSIIEKRLGSVSRLIEAFDRLQNLPLGDQDTADLVMAKTDLVMAIVAVSIAHGGPARFRVSE